MSEIQKDMLTGLLGWMTEREVIRVRKEQGAPRPWGTHWAINKFRFCNVHREDDRVTRWIAAKWRTPGENLPDLWFWMLIARLLNQPESLALLPKPGKKWDAAKFVQVLHKHREAGGKVFNAAYIVSTNGRAMGKVEYLAREVLTPAWERAAYIRPTEGDSLASFAARLRILNGLAGFMVGQVVADMKYVNPLLQAHDWVTWAGSGPGSRRGLNRMVGREPGANWKEPEWHGYLMELLALVKSNGFDLHAQDLQNCLCEFDKYQRVVLGEGVPKQLYAPSEKEMP